MNRYSIFTLSIVMSWTGFFIYQWSAPQGIRTLLELQHALEEQKKNIKQLSSTLAAEQTDLYRITHDQFYAEQIIRKTCLYARPGEKIKYYRSS